MQAYDIELQRIFNLVKASGGRPDPFQVLGVSRTLSADSESEIRQQYRDRVAALSVVFLFATAHFWLLGDIWRTIYRNVMSVVSPTSIALAPASSSSNLFEEAFKYVADAYNELSDPMRRLELLRSNSQVSRTARKTRQYRSTDTEQYQMYSQLCDSLLKNFTGRPAAAPAAPVAPQGSQIPWDLIQRLKATASSLPVSDPSSPLVPPPPVVAAAFSKISTTQSTTTTTTTTNTTKSQPSPVRKKNSTPSRPAAAATKPKFTTTKTTTKTTTTTTTTTTTSARVTTFSPASFTGNSAPQRPIDHFHIGGARSQISSTSDILSAPNPKRIKVEASNAPEVSLDDLEAALLLKEFVNGLGDTKQ